MKKTGSGRIVNSGLPSSRSPLQHQRFRPVKRSFFLPTIAKCLLTGCHVIIGVSVFIVAFTVVVNWHYENKIELNNL